MNSNENKFECCKFGVSSKGKDLNEFFNANGGNVVYAKVIFQDKSIRSAGYGFVSFNTEAEALATLATFEGKEFMGRPIRVAVEDF